MKKIFLIIFLFIFTLPVSAGNNLSVTCDALSCTKSSNLHLFNEINIVPGFSKSQTITVKNEHTNSCNLQFKINETSTKSPLSSVQMLSIFVGENLWQAGSFNDFTNNKYYKLGNIDSYQYKDYQWTASLNQSLGNEYQQLSSFFDLDLNFICGEEEDGDNNTCNQVSPLHYPLNLKAIVGQNSVSLTWDETEDIFSYYLITYSTENHAATFANANIGGRGTTSFTINNLEGNVTYYFKIRTGNICAPGPFSEIVSATPSSQNLSNISSPTFHPTILGENNSFSSIPGAVAKPTKCFNVFPYAFILALFINIIISRYYFISFLISLLSFIGDYYLNKHLCRNYHYFYINNLLSFVLPFLFSLKKQKT